MQNQNVKWVVDELLTERYDRVGQPSLAEACRELGIPVYQTKYVPFSKEPDPEIPFGAGECVVAYGTHEFVRQVHKKYRAHWIPGAYYRIENLSYLAFSVHIGDLLLNDDFVLLPLAEIVRRKEWLYEKLAVGGEIFIKPNAVTKSFTGLCISHSEFDHEINALSKIQQPEPDTLCVVASPKPLRGEFRFVIANRKIVAESEYRWDGKLDIRIDVHPECRKVAEEVARRPWQPDHVYVCDVALTERGGVECARVVELNTFCCAGLYACDTREIVRAVSETAWAEFTGTLD